MVRTSNRSTDAETGADSSSAAWRTPLIQGLRRVAEGNFPAALPSLERAHRLGPNVPEVCLAYGRELLRVGDERGLALVEQAHDSSPRLTSATCELARHLAARGDFDRAKQVLACGRERHSGDPLLSLASGEVALDSGDLDEAEREANQVALHCSDSRYQEAARSILSRCANHRGLALAAEEKFTTAVFAFKRAHDLDPCWPGPLINMGAAFTRLGRHKRALGLYMQAERLAPQSSLVAYNIGLEHMELGDFSKARYWLERSTVLLKGSDADNREELAQAHRHLARVYLQLGAEARAVRSLEIASHFAGAGAEIWAELSEAHVHCGELSKARRAARIALALAPENERVREAWIVYARAKNRAQARKSPQRDSH